MEGRGRGDHRAGHCRAWRVMEEKHAGVLDRRSTPGGNAGGGFNLTAPAAGGPALQLLFFFLFFFGAFDAMTGAQGTRRSSNQGWRWLRTASRNVANTVERALAVKEFPERMGETRNRGSWFAGPSRAGFSVTQTAFPRDSANAIRANLDLSTPRR